jgi:hypothetical protein
MRKRSFFATKKSRAGSFRGSKKKSGKKITRKFSKFGVGTGQQKQNPNPKKKEKKKLPLPHPACSLGNKHKFSQLVKSSEFSGQPKKREKIPHFFKLKKKNGTSKKGKKFTCACSFLIPRVS